jgi:hypothetical protein
MTLRRDVLMDGWRRNSLPESFLFPKEDTGILCCSPLFFSYFLIKFSLLNNIRSFMAFLESILL